MFVRSAVAIILLALMAYGFMEAEPLIAGPSLTLSSPENDATSADGFVTVAGVAKRVTHLTLNGVPLLIDENGAFSRTVVLPHGSAILTIVATDRFNRSITKQESVYVP